VFQQDVNAGIGNGQLFTEKFGLRRATDHQGIGPTGEAEKAGGHVATAASKVVSKKVELGPVGPLSQQRDQRQSDGLTLAEYDIVMTKLIRQPSRHRPRFARPDQPRSQSV
jgi:hypothetical protein